MNSSSNSLVRVDIGDRTFFAETSTSQIELVDKFNGQVELPWTVFEFEQMLIKLRAMASQIRSKRAVAHRLGNLPMRPRRP